MKRFNEIIATLSVLVIFSFIIPGCKKSFLDEENKSALTQDNYFITENQAQAAVNGIYEKLNTFIREDGYGESPWVSLEMPVGHATTLGQSTFNNGLIMHTSSPIEPVFKSVWSNFYTGIANANQAIAKIPGIRMNEAKKKAFLGEAYFLRAFYYYHLVRLYGDIPLITDIMTTASPDFYPARSPAEKVYELIISDLKMTENSGLPFVDRTGRVSLAAAKSLLSGVYLTMAGYPLNKGTEYYQLAAAKAEEVIDNGSYTLFSDYAFLHDRAHKNLGELILQVQYLVGTVTNRLTQEITPEKAGISKFVDEYGSIIARNEFVDSYEPGDKRAEEKQFFFTEYSKDGVTIKKFNQYALYKFWLEEAAGRNGDLNSDENWTLLRLPEVMLIYAEASNEINGPTEKARDQLAAIRNRAQLTTPDLSAFDKDSFREAVWRERYHELAFENKAYFDIQRTHKVFNLSAGNFEDAFSYVNESGVKFNQQYMLWPISQDEIDTNPGLKPQNPGW